MKKKLSALLLALLVLLTVPAHAAENSTENFVRQRTYTGQFSDIPQTSPFYDNIAALYEYSLTQGRADGTYGPGDPMSVGQIIIFAGRIRSLYRSGSAEAGPAAYQEAGAGTAQAYLRYLQAEGVLGQELDAELSKAATRAQVAHVLANVLPEEALPAVYDELVTQAHASRHYIKDVSADTPYYQDILDLYRRGVSGGSDAAGTYRPGDPITRGAAAAMLTRMVDPSLRVMLQWDLSSLYSAAGTKLSDLVEPGEYVLSPSNLEEMDRAVRSMLSKDSNQLLLYYPGVNAAQAKQIMDQSLSAVKVYCEQGYNAVNCSYSAAGPVTLTFSAAGAGNHLQEYRSATMNAAIAVHDQLWKEGAITAGMTEKEKAKVYYEWVCNNCVYDYRAGDTSLSHIAYSLFQKGTAVCDGYTGAYNLLLKLEGIECTALSNSSHIWTVATLDGVSCHIDTTWGDSGSRISYDYFAMTPEQSRSYHPW